MTRHSLTVAVAGVVIQVDLPEQDWANMLQQRYVAFISADAPRWQVAVHQNAGQGFADPGWARHDGDLTAFHIHQYRGEIDLAARSAWVTAPSIERLASALERTLTYILMQALPRERGALLLHACGVDLAGRGYAFFGPSGAGKTTVARLAKGHGTVLCDENVVLRLTDRGASLVSTPFWGTSTPPDLVRRVDQSAPLAGLFRLAHAPDFSLTRLPSAQAVAALLDTEKVATERVESATAWLTVAARLVDQIPVYTLGFPPTEELWSFLLRHEGGKVA